MIKAVKRQIKICRNIRLSHVATFYVNLNLEEVKIQLQTLPQKERRINFKHSITE